MDPVIKNSCAVPPAWTPVRQDAIVAAALEDQRAALFLTLARVLVDFEAVDGEHPPKRLWVDGHGLQLVNRQLLHDLLQEFVSRAMQAFRARDALRGHREQHAEHPR